MKQIFSSTRLSRRQSLRILMSGCVVLATRPAIATELTDATGRVVSFSDPKRIVSIGGAATETIFALGEGKRVAAIDTTSTYPPEAGTLPNVGYMRALSAEGVLAIGPDLIIALEGSGPPAAISALEKSRVPVLLVPNKSSAEGTIEKIDFLGKALGAEARAADLNAKIKQGLGDLGATLANAGRKTARAVHPEQRQWQDDGGGREEFRRCDDHARRRRQCHHRLRRLQTGECRGARRRISRCDRHDEQPDRAPMPPSRFWQRLRLPARRPWRKSASP